MEEAFVKNINEIKPVCPPLHVKTNAWPLVTPKNGGGDSVEFYVSEMQPGGGALEDIHAESDHVFFFISGKGYSIVEGKKFAVGENDVLWIPRNNKHELGVVENRLDF